MSVSLNPTAGTVRTGIEQISNMIEAARRLIGEGHLVDLRLLESRVESFCGSLRNVPVDLAAELRPAMLGLIDDLSQLEQEIRRIQSETSSPSSPPSFSPSSACLPGRPAASACPAGSVPWRAARAAFTWSRWRRSTPRPVWCSCAGTTSSIS